MKMEDQIIKQAEKLAEETTELLAALVRIESLTGNEGQIQEKIATDLKAMGLKVDLWEPSLAELKSHPIYQPVSESFRGRPNVVGIWEGKGNGRSLLLNGHVDIVKPGPGWTHAPFSGEIQEGKLYGRGASDMKSGVAAMIMALKVLKSLGLQPKGRVLFETVVDEENGINGSLAGLMRGYTADACINCEASDLEIQRAHSGIMEYKLRVYGKATPISRKDEAVSPIEKGFRMVQALSDLESSMRITHRHSLFPPRSMNIYITSFHAGVQTTIYPGEAVIGGMVRLLPGMGAQETRRQVEEFISNVANLDPFMRTNPPKMEWGGLYAESMEVAESHPLVSCLGESFLAAAKRPPRISGHEGACDPWVINNHWKIPTVIFGPGRITQMHAVDEYVEIQDLLLAVKTLALAIYAWSFKEDKT